MSDWNSGVYLSEAGTARRGEILAAAQGVLRRRRARRGAARAGLAVSLPVLALAAWMWAARVRTPVIPGPSGGGQIAHPGNDGGAAEPEFTMQFAVFEVVHDDAARGVQRIDDEQLLAVLSETGCPYGLVRTDSGAEVFGGCGSQ